MLPSSVAGGAGGIIDATKDATFVAQLNASTWIDAYKLVIRQNTADNTVVYNTGIVQLDEPFYPTDSTGKYVPFEVVVGASSAPLTLIGTSISPDFKTVWLEFNVAIKFGSDKPANGIMLSIDNGETWEGTNSNRIVETVIKGSSLKITFTYPLNGRLNKVSMANNTVLPVNDYYQVGTDAVVTDAIIGFLEDSLVSLNVTSATISAGGSFSATVTGNKDGYMISRNAIISVINNGDDKKTELASRTQADNRVSYSIMGDYIYFNAGASLAAGDYTITYTDLALPEGIQSVSYVVHVVGVGALTYTDIELDETHSVVALTMTSTVANAKASLDELAQAILLSTDGGVTWTGTESNSIVAVGFTNTEKTYSAPAINNMRIAFANPLSGDSNIIKIPADSLSGGTGKSPEIITHPIVIDPEDVAQELPAEETAVDAMPNCMVNGFAHGYKWVLTVWNGYDASDPEAKCIESFEACFDAKDTPIVNVEYDPLVKARTGKWTGSYSQGQSIPLMWHKWQLTTNGEVIHDTGNIYSNNSLAFEYDGLISGQTYTIKLICTTQDGVEVTDGGEFEVQYATMDSDGLVRVYQRKDGSIEFQCTQPDYITGVVSGLNISFLPDEPVDGRTSISTGHDTTIKFKSTADFAMDFSDGDTLVVRIHSTHDGELLRFDSDDGRFYFSLQHRGLVGGLAPNYDLYPAHDLYPDGTEWGEFVYYVNGEVAAIVPSPNYANTWYTLHITTKTFDMYESLQY